ncbi:MAG: ABC transporter substrate-binding protein [Verrucomicrobia bacterium]|nr:ABC transporter substrate-binding protein [Verrucomicrobiota bacterium]
MKHTMKAIAALLVAALTGSAHAAETKTLKVGYNNWVGFIAFFVAQDKGYFKQAGLDVQPKVFSAPGEGLVPLISGDLDIHLSTVDAAILRSANAPGSLKVVALVDTSAGADAVLGGPGVKTPADLKGKKIAVTLGECNEVLLQKALQAGGLTEKDVTLVNMDPDAAGTALKAGNVDAAVTWEPWISQLVGAGNANAVFTSKQAPNVLTDCVVISAQGEKAKKAKIAAFLAAMNKATEFVKAHPDEAAAIAGKALEVPAEDIKGMLGKVTLYDQATSSAQMKGEAAKSADELLIFFKNKGSVAKDATVAGLLAPDFAK